MKLVYFPGNLKFYIARFWITRSIVRRYHISEEPVASIFTYDTTRCSNLDNHNQNILNVNKLLLTQFHMFLSECTLLN